MGGLKGVKTIRIDENAKRWMLIGEKLYFIRLEGARIWMYKNWGGRSIEHILCEECCSP